MSYPNILGHDEIKHRFQNAIHEKKISHAYLFYGMEGVGKFRFAREFAKALQCLENKGEPCMICPSCQKAEHNNHPDIAIYQSHEDKLSIPIETIRQIQREISYTPLEGNYRVVLVNNAHEMGEESANAFLKTLEEPSPQGILILITHAFPSLLPTIISRCQRVKFSPLSESLIESHLRQKGISPDLCSLYAASSMGSLKTAKEFSEENWIMERDSLLEILKNLESLNEAEISKKIYALVEPTPAEKRRKKFISFLEIFTSLLRDQLLSLLSIQLNLIHQDRSSDLQQIPISIEKSLQIQEALSEYRKELEGNFHLEFLADRLSISLKG